MTPINNVDQLKEAFNKDNQFSKTEKDALDVTSNVDVYQSPEVKDFVNKEVVTVGGKNMTMENLVKNIDVSDGTILVNGQRVDITKKSELGAKIQIFLIANGYTVYTNKTGGESKLTIDGIVGENTRSAIEDYQLGKQIEKQQKNFITKAEAKYGSVKGHVIEDWNLINRAEVAPSLTDPRVNKIFTRAKIAKKLPNINDTNIRGDAAQVQIDLRTMLGTKGTYNLDMTKFVLKEPNISGSYIDIQGLVNEMSKKLERLYCTEIVNTDGKKIQDLQKREKLIQNADQREALARDARTVLAEIRSHEKEYKIIGREDLRNYRVNELPRIINKRTGL